MSEFLLDRETGVCERACAKLGAAVTPGKVQLSRERTTMWQVFSFYFVGFRGRGEKKEKIKRKKKEKKSDDRWGGNVKFFGISGCSCVSFGLAFTPSRPTHSPPLPPQKKEQKKKKRKDEQRGATRTDIVFIWFLFLLFCTSVEVAD